MTTTKPRFEDMVLIETRFAEALGRSIEEIRKMDLQELAELVHDRGLEMKVSFPQHDGGPYHLLMRVVDGQPEPDAGMQSAA